MDTAKVINGGPYPSYNDRKYDASVMSNMLDGILISYGAGVGRTPYPGTGVLDDGTYGEKYGKFEIEPNGGNTVRLKRTLCSNAAKGVCTPDYITGIPDALRSTYGSGYRIPEEDDIFTFTPVDGDYAEIYWLFIQMRGTPEDLQLVGRNLYGTRSMKAIAVKYKGSTILPANISRTDRLIDVTNPMGDMMNYPEVSVGNFDTMMMLGYVIVRPSGEITSDDIMDSRDRSIFGEIASQPLPQIQTYIDLLKEYGTPGKIVRSKVLQNHNVWIDHLSSSDVGIATPNNSRIRITDSQAEDIHQIIAVVLSAAWPQSAWAPIYLARHGDTVESDDNGKYISAWLYSTSDGAPPWYIWPNIDQYYKCDFTVYYI